MVDTVVVKAMLVSQVHHTFHYCKFGLQRSSYYHMLLGLQDTCMIHSDKFDHQYTLDHKRRSY